MFHANSVPENTGYIQMINVQHATAYYLSQLCLPQAQFAPRFVTLRLESPIKLCATATVFHFFGPGLWLGVWAFLSPVLCGL